MLHYLQVIYINYIKQMKLLELQHNKILTLQHLSRDIHNSGYKYCHSNLESITPITDHIPAIDSCNVNNKVCIRLLPLDIQQRIARQDIMPNSDILILNFVPLNFQILANGITECTPLTVLYYLRRSLVEEFKNADLYTLYRDDIIHNAVAITEGFTNFKISISHISSYQAVEVKLQVTKANDINFIFTTRNQILT